MKKKVSVELEDDLRCEYDLRKLLKRGVRGKYLKQYHAGTNLVLLEPDIARAFSNSQKAVNETLRLVLQLARIRGANKPKKAKRAD